MLFTHIKKILIFQVIALGFIHPPALYSSVDAPYEILGLEELIQESKYICQRGICGIKELQGKHVGSMPSDAFLTYDETIAEDDILNIQVYHSSRRDWMEAVLQVNEQRGGVRVVNGCISMPGIDSLPVVGMTLKEARQAIQSQLKVKGAHVFITFKQKKSNVVEICGFTARAVIPVNGKTRLYEILAKAQIPSDANLFASYVLREGKKLKVDLHQLMMQGDMSQNIVMKGKDKIFIASPGTDFAFLLEETVDLLLTPGAPLQPSRVSCHRIPLPSGYATLHDAFVRVCGIPSTTFKTSIQVIRHGSDGIKIFVIPWNTIYHARSQDLLLMPDDIVYVSLAPISQWKVFFDQFMNDEVVGRIITIINSK